MNWNVKALKRVAQTTLLSSSLVLGLAMTTSAQNPYWNDRYNGGSVKRHQKEEKREQRRQDRALFSQRTLLIRVSETKECSFAPVRCEQLHSDRQAFG